MCFLAGQPPACPGAWLALLWMQDLALPLVDVPELPVSPAPVTQAPSGWQHNPLVYQASLPVMCHHQPCWGYALHHHPDHWWRFWTGLDPVLTPGVHCYLLASNWTSCHWWLVISGGSLWLSIWWDIQVFLLSEILLLTVLGYTRSSEINFSAFFLTVRLGNP